MKTTIVNPKFDAEDTTESALDYALYSQICRVNLGFGPSRNGDAERYEMMLSNHPRRIDAETDLRGFGLGI